MEKDLNKIKLLTGKTAAEYLRTRPQDSRSVEIEALFECIKKNLPLIDGCIQREARAIKRSKRSEIMKAQDGVSSLFPGMSKEEAKEFQWCLINRPFKCGTPFEYEVSRAVKAFHAGEPVSSSVAIEEIILIVHDDWRETGRMFNADGTDEIIYTPRIDVEGGEENILMYFKDDIKGFVPERGHSYRLRVRRFLVIREPDHNRYELLEILSDTPASL